MPKKTSATWDKSAKNIIQAKLKDKREIEKDGFVHSIDPNSAAMKEQKKTVHTIFFSSLILLGIFILFEILLLVQSGGFGDLNVHMLNMADNTLAFVIGLGAMDAVAYFNNVGKERRMEIRAIIRHNRLLEQNIESFTSRKNILLDADQGSYSDQLSDVKLDQFADMFESSTIATDAGLSKLRMYSIHSDKLYSAFKYMVQDIDFKFNPAACDAALSFIRATDRGTSILAALLSYENEDMKTKRSSLLKAIKQESKSESQEPGSETVGVYVLMQIIDEQQKAIVQYHKQVANIVNTDVRNL